MQTEQIDLKLLVSTIENLGYKIEFLNELLVKIGPVRYFNVSGEVKEGYFVSTIHKMNDKLLRCGNHVIGFIGESFPYKHNGKKLNCLMHKSVKHMFNGVSVDHSFSNKPRQGYKNDIEKFKTYIKIIGGEVENA